MENVNMESINMENIETPEPEAARREQNRGIAFGLKLFFMGTLGQFISLVTILALVLIVLFGRYANTVMMGILVLAAVVAGVFTLVGIVGLYDAGRYLRGCSIAFTLVCLSLVLIIFEHIPETKTIATILREIFAIAEVYFVITPVVAVLKEIGASDIASLGKLVWWLEVVWYLLGIYVQLRPGVGIISVVYLIMFFVVYIMYLKFLYNSYYILSA